MTKCSGDVGSRERADAPLHAIPSRSPTQAKVGGSCRACSLYLVYCMTTALGKRKGMRKAVVHGSHIG